MDIYGRASKLGEKQTMDYIKSLISFSIFVGFFILTWYNLLYAVRTNGADHQLGLGLSPLVKSLLFVTVMICAVMSFISLAIFW